MHRNVVNVGIGDRSHLQRLNRRGFAIRMQDENGNSLLAPYSVDSGTAGIARCCPYDVHCLFAFGQDVLKQIAEKLQRNILESKCHAMKQFKNIHAILFDQRGDFRVCKGGV